MDHEVEHVSLDKVHNYQKAAEEALQQGNYQDGYALLCLALEALGEDYTDSSIIDDTGVAIYAAQDLHEQGKVDNAVRMLGSILSTRISLYERKHSFAPDESHCPICSMSNSPEARFCSHCGAALKSSTP